MTNGSITCVANLCWPIADDVTGELDVRHAASGLPDEEADAEEVDA